MTTQPEQQKPAITLTPLEKTVVHTPTKQDYKTLMRVYECGGWRWRCGSQPTLEQQHFNFYGIKTCIETRDSFLYCSKEFFEDKGSNIISPNKFYRIQKVTLRDILQVNRWFDQHGN